MWIGYVRVSKAEGSQTTGLQRDALMAAGVSPAHLHPASAMSAAKVRLAMGQPETKVGDLCQELGITRQTLYRHISPEGKLRPDGAKLLSRA